MLPKLVAKMAMVFTVVIPLSFVLSSTGANASSVSPPPPHAVGIAYDQAGNGGWIAMSDGSVQTFGPAFSYGGVSNLKLSAPIVGIATTPDDSGYWLVAADGGVFTFGDAQFYGSAAGIKLNAPITGITSTADGKGYWLVGADGGVFTFGDAPYYGRTYYEPTAAVGIARINTTTGYQLVDADGATTGLEYLKGGAGSAFPLNAPIVGIVSDPAVPTGYWFVAADGGVFSFGTPFYGSLGNYPLPSAVGTIVGMAVNLSGSCYSLVNTKSMVFTFCDSTGQQVAPYAVSVP